MMLSVLFADSASAALGEIDLEKFKKESNLRLENIYGAENLEAEGSLYFQDGVGTGSEVFSDFATLTYVRRSRVPLEHRSIDAVGYRLELNGKLRPVNVQFRRTSRNEVRALVFAFPGTALTMLTRGTSLSRAHEISGAVSEQFPNVRITLFESFLMMQIEGPPREMPEIVQMLSKEKEYAGTDLNYEIYAYPAEFDRAKELVQITGVVDLDALRTVSGKYKKAGIPFATETTIPQSLKP